MRLKVFKTKVYALIEELSPNSPYLTDDTDLQAKFNEVTNQRMYELARIKKIPKYCEIKVSKGDLLDFNAIEGNCGYAVYQLNKVSGVSYLPKADGTVLKILEDGTAEVEVYVYPDRITEKDKDTSYEIEMDADAIEVMVYGVAADLLLADVSANYGNAYAQKYLELKQGLDPRHQMPTIYVDGGVDF